MYNKKYRFSDFFLDFLKQLGFFIVFHLVGYVAYALSAGHVIRDELVDRSTKSTYLVLFSLAMLIALAVFKYMRVKGDVGRKTKLIELSRDDDFDFKLYLKEQYKRLVLPFMVALIFFALPYSIFYMFYGFGYENALITERFFATTIAGTFIFRGFIGPFVQGAIVSAAYAYSLYKIQKAELDDRMWLKDAPKQEFVAQSVNKRKDNYKNY